MKIWLDDIREPPDEGWLWFKSVETARLYFEVAEDMLEECEISLDHDLGENHPTGYDLIKWLEEKVMTGKVTTQGYSFPKIRVHSANPVGRKNIEAAVKRIEEFLASKKD